MNPFQWQMNADSRQHLSGIISIDVKLKVITVVKLRDKKVQGATKVIDFA